MLVEGLEGVRAPRGARRFGAGRDGRAADLDLGDPRRIGARAALVAGDGLVGVVAVAAVGGRVEGHVEGLADAQHLRRRAVERQRKPRVRARPEVGPEDRGLRAGLDALALLGAKGRRNEADGAHAPRAPRARVVVVEAAIANAAADGAGFFVAVAARRGVLDAHRELQAHLAVEGLVAGEVLDLLLVEGHAVAVPEVRDAADLDARREVAVRERRAARQPKDVVAAPRPRRRDEVQLVADGDVERLHVLAADEPRVRRAPDDVVDAAPAPRRRAADVVRRALEVAGPAEGGTQERQPDEARPPTEQKKPHHFLTEERAHRCCPLLSI